MTTFDQDIKNQQCHTGETNRGEGIGERAYTAAEGVGQRARETAENIKHRARETTVNLRERARRMKEQAREQLMYEQDHSEGRVARMLENQTARLPSDVFLWAAGGCIAASLALKMSNRHADALFVGQWAPTLLILGLYNKIVKTHGHDELDHDYDWSAGAYDESMYSEPEYESAGQPSGVGQYGGGMP